MKRTSTLIAASALVLAMTQWSSAATTPTARPDHPFRTTADPMMKALVAGVDIVPLISAGDVVGGRLGGFQYTGVPDGLGTYASRQPPRGFHQPRGPSHGDPGCLSGLGVYRPRSTGRWRGRGELCHGRGPSATNTSALSTMDTIKGVPWYLTGGGMDRLAPRWHVGGDQRPDGPSDPDAAVRRTQRRERRPFEGHERGRDVPVRGLSSGCARRPTATSPTASRALSRARARSPCGCPMTARPTATPRPTTSTRARR